MNNLKKVALIIFFNLCLLFNSTICSATHFYTATLEELVKGSNFVFVGEVKQVRRTLLGYRKASLKVIEKIKGNILTEITVKYGEPWHYSQTNVPALDDGKLYLFFIVEIEGESHLTGIVGPKYYEVEDNGEVLCGDEKIQLNECIEKGRAIRGE